MPQYLLTIYQPEGPIPPPEVLEPIMREIAAIRKELEAAGAWIFAGGLHAPSASTVVRLKDGEVLTIDGPYVEGKEYVGGFTIIQVPDLDAALAWASRYARVTTLPIEVRPFR
jgi:hypothetical protein